MIQTFPLKKEKKKKSPSPTAKLISPIHRKFLHTEKKEGDACSSRLYQEGLSTIENKRYHACMISSLFSNYRYNSTCSTSDEGSNFFFYFFYYNGVYRTKANSYAHNLQNNIHAMPII